MFYRGLGLRLIVSSPHYARFECPDGGSTFSVHLAEEIAPNSGITVYFECEDLDQKVGHLKSIGYRFTREPRDERWLWREARLRDPANNEICLYWAGENRRFPPWRLLDDLPLETQSLRLRQLVPDDAALMMALNAEPSTSQWLPSHVYPNLAEARSRMEYLISCYSTPGHPLQGPYVLAVEHKHSGSLLGHVGFSEFNGEVEVSYAIAESSRGRGYGTEALVCACKWAVAAFALPRLLAITESANASSRRLLARAKFVQEEEVLMPFQGKEQLVCRYTWRPWNQGSGA